MFSADVTNRDPAEILLKITADREFFLAGSNGSHVCESERAQNPKLTVVTTICP